MSKRYRLMRRKLPKPGNNMTVQEPNSRKAMRYVKQVMLQNENCSGITKMVATEGPSCKCDKFPFRTPVQVEQI